MENLLNFPTSTRLKIVIPKTAFYKHLDVNTKIKQDFVEGVDKITWIYKLAPSVLNVNEGKEVSEIAIFQVQLKSKKYPNNLFLFIDKYLPRHTVFLLQYQEEYRLLLNYKEWQNRERNTYIILQSFVSAWMTRENLRLPLQGQTMDIIYENFAGTISGYGTSTREDTKQIIALEHQIQQKVRQAEALQKRVRLEPQVNRQIAENTEARSLKQEIKVLRQEIEKLKKGKT